MSTVCTPYESTDCDGIWTVISAILALAGAVPPVCMTFLHGDQETVNNLEVPTS